MARKKVDAEKRRRGAFYTPPRMTDHMASMAIDARLLDIIGSKGSIGWSSLEDIMADGTSKDLNILVDALACLTILDPACGDGAFLLSCLEHLSVLWGACLTPSRPLKGRYKGLRADNIKRTIALKNLFGVDVDETAVARCRRALAREAGLGAKAAIGLDENIRQGNSLLGFVKVPGDAKGDPDKAYMSFLARSIDAPYLEALKAQRLLHWSKEFPRILGRGGFDIIIGNPPYGDGTLTDGERAAIRASYSLGTTSTDEHSKGSANPSSVFIERCYDILTNGGQLALVLPTSIARVKEFQRTRRFLMDHMPPWHIVDEGSPFKGVTLEMLTLFARKGQPPEGLEVEVSARQGTSSWKVPAAVFRRYDRFMLYWDQTFETVTTGAETGLLSGRRGPTIPKERCTRRMDKNFPVPLLVSGKAVQRYRLVPSEFVHARQDVLGSPEAKAIHGSTLLVGARLMDHYRVCVKPPGLLVGDNVVRLDFDPAKATPEALCVILNSSMMHHIVRRYLFNQSNLTMFIQSVAEATPVRPPRDMALFTDLGRLMLALGQAWPASRQIMDEMDRWVLDPLVYELYLFDGNVDLAMALSSMVPHVAPKADPVTLAEGLVTKVMDNRNMKRILECINSENVVIEVEKTLATRGKVI